MDLAPMPSVPPPQAVAVLLSAHLGWIVTAVILAAHAQGTMTRTSGTIESGKWVANKFAPSWLLCFDCKIIGVAMCADCVYTDD